jgi:amidophosphoribosyltransferase
MDFVMCGIFGIFGHSEAAKLVYLGLHGLQHRGQESAGIVSADAERLYTSRHMGLVGEVFTSERLQKLPGQMAIGHVRYSTAGESRIAEAQPFAVDCFHGSVAVAHNGNLVNVDALRNELEAMGSIFRSSADTEVVVHLMARSKQPDLSGRLIEALDAVRGAYSLLALSAEGLAAIRDPHGIRPLILGRLEGAYVLSSESSAFGLIGAEPIRDLEPGELVLIDRDGLRSFHPFALHKPKFCVFERVYFARPDSVLEQRSVYTDRVRMGGRLAVEHPVEADVVVPVPDSGLPAAIGYSQQSGIPLTLGLIRSHYVGRTFIEPQQSIRHFGVKLKLAPVVAVLRGKRVVVIDDSIVRGTTSRKIIKMIRNAGARTVHLRISSPPTAHPCYYGIDTPHRRELIAANHEIKEIAAYTGADTVGYLSQQGLMEAVGDPEGTHHCDACFSGRYPIAVDCFQPLQRQLKLVGT